MVVIRGGGGDTHCLSRRSFSVSRRLKSGQMISAQLQNAHRHRKGYRPGAMKCVCAGKWTAVWSDGLRSKNEYT